MYVRKGDEKDDISKLLQYGIDFYIDTLAPKFQNPCIKFLGKLAKLSHWQLFGIKVSLSQISARMCRDLHQLVSNIPSGGIVMDYCFIAVNFRRVAHHLTNFTLKVVTATRLYFCWMLMLISVLGQLPMRTIPHQIKIKPNHCPPGPQSLGLFPTRTTPH